MFPIVQQQHKWQMATTAKVRRTQIMCCLRVHPPSLIGLCCQSYFGLPEAWGQHISTTVCCSVDCQPGGSLLRVDPLMLLLPRRPIHPPAGKHLHPLGCSKAPSVNGKGSSAFSNWLDHIPARRLSAHYAVIPNNLCPGDCLTSAYISHLKPHGLSGWGSTLLTLLY